MLGRKLVPGKEQVGLEQDIMAQIKWLQDNQIRFKMPDLDRKEREKQEL